VWRQLVVPSCISDQSLLRAFRASETPIHFLFGFLLLLYSFSWIVERPWRMAVFSEKGPEQPANQGREHLWCKTHIHDLQVKTQAA
jgi:hypothetical protein